jgi:hypothetical protein
MTGLAPLCRKIQIIQWTEEEKEEDGIKKFPIFPLQGWSSQSARHPSI